VAGLCPFANQEVAYFVGSNSTNGVATILMNIEANTVGVRNEVHFSVIYEVNL
jgi:hypothetical protein